MSVAIEIMSCLALSAFIGSALVFCHVAGCLATSIERIAQILNRMEGK